MYEETRSLSLRQRLRCPDQVGVLLLRKSARSSATTLSFRKVGAPLPSPSHDSSLLCHCTTSALNLSRRPSLLPSQRYSSYRSIHSLLLSAIRLDVRIEAPHLRRHRLVARLCHGQALGGEAQALLLVGLVNGAGFVFLAAVVCMRGR